MERSCFPEDITDVLCQNVRIQYGCFHSLHDTFSHPYSNCQLRHRSLVLPVYAVDGLVVRKGTVRNLGFEKANFQRSLPQTSGLIVIWPLTFLFVPEIMGEAPLTVQSLFLDDSIFFYSGLLEELCFRGSLETRLERLFSVGKALVIQAVIFGLYHLPPVVSGDPRWLVVGGQFNPFIAFILGVIMGIIYIKTRNLFVDIGLHGSLLEFFLLTGILRA